MDIDDGKLSKSQAKDKCYELGSIFIEYFHNLYSDPSSINARRWISIMQSCYDYVSNITFRYNGKKISKERLISWFFNSSNNLYIKMTNKESNDYNEFVNNICYGMKVRDSFYKIFYK